MLDFRSCRPLDPQPNFLGTSQNLRSTSYYQKHWNPWLVNDTESLISQYADDTFLVLDGCETSLRETLICFETFYFKASGLKINTSKTRVVWVGNKRYSNQILSPDFKLNWSVINFKLLGIDFSLDLSSMPDLNSRKKIIHVWKILKCWRHRKAHPSWEGNRDKNTCTSKTYSFTYLTAKFKTITV